MAFLFLLSLAAYVSSAPVASVASVAPTPTPAAVAPIAAEGERVGWTSNPDGRGTSKIIISCSLTIALCIWTAIHPDLVRKPLKDKADPSGSENSSSAGAETPDGEEVNPRSDTNTPDSAQTAVAPCPTCGETQKSRRDATPGVGGGAVAPSRGHTSSPDPITADHMGGNTSVTSHSVNATPPAATGDSKSQPGAPEPNKPPQSDVSKRFWQKLYLSFKALFMPEEVVTDARKQWIHAFRLHRAMIAGHYILHNTSTDENNNYIFEENRVGPFNCCEVKDPVKWDVFRKEVAFFVVQGGFVRKDGTLISPLDLYSAYMTNPKSVRDQIKVEDIRDKGNANVLTKVIVSFQCGWYVLNLLARLVSGLPIALLELHAMIHIVATLVMYMFWWNKQLDVSEPIILEIPHFKYNKTWADVPIEAVRPSKGWKRPLSEVWVLPPKKHDEIKWNAAIDALKALKTEFIALEKEPLSSADSTYDDCNCGMNGDGLFQRLLSDWGSFLQRGPKIRTKDQETTSRGETGEEEKGSKTTTTTIPADPSPDSHLENEDEKDERFSGINLKLACAFYITYAGLHATGGRFSFPSKEEQLIWRISCLVIAITPFLIALVKRILKMMKISAKEDGLRGLWFNGILCILYLGGAWTLLIESILSLRNQPKELYQTLDLSIYVPHI
ncbi:uncharacterized protein H6S33_011130 [Morchella sextelata]|uniref:uncharacterized protein n=1 Tax=Morchella sextelata TaxID=1174677 RepID=UPI001D05BDD2|nr:uncharacterized protein H6S33_011130 [Morchella sextelata]KAH0611865.1 hypothetical protein H6S33_011130 [Morchella sextelata]